MEIVAILALLVSVISAYYARKAIIQNRRRNEEARREREEDRIRRRIDNTAKLYVEQESNRKDSGLSAFLKSDIGGLSTSELEAAAERIRSSTGTDPLDQIRDALRENDIDLRVFLDHVVERRYNPHTNWNLDRIEPVQYYNLLLCMDFQSVILKSNPTTPQKMGILCF